MLKVRMLHDCQKPDMVVGTEVVEVPVRRWLKWWTETVEFVVYRQQSALWECPECQSTWEWTPRPNKHLPGRWTALFRTETWEEVPE